jgi:multidrug transporter EmrE-like cation transporter
MTGYFYILGTIVCTVYGQLILKWRIGKYGELPDAFFDKLVFLFKLLFDPFIFSGFAVAILASFFWMAAMTKFDVSYAYPFITAGLTLLTVILAILLLGESFTLPKVLGVLFIVIGVSIMGFGVKA